VIERRTEGPKRLPDAARETLLPWSEGLSALYALVEDLDDEGRRELRVAAEFTTQTNCAWHEYEAADIALKALRMTASCSQRQFMTGRGGVNGTQGD
jgi:hypothetical protein